MNNKKRYIQHLAGLYGLLLFTQSCASIHHNPITVSTCAKEVLDIDGNHIWVNKEGSGAVTVVFEAGFGNDSTVWSEVALQVRKMGAQTFIYDRAGMGNSTINTNIPYSIKNDVHILKTALSSCGIQAPMVLVGHSYGGGISLMAASDDERVRGVVLLDAVVPNTWPPAELQKNLAEMRLQYDEIRQKAPALAKVAIPWAEALPATVQQLDNLHIPSNLPIIDIVAENSQDSQEKNKLWHQTHRDFTAGHPSREFILAAGSSHKVMIDKRELVIDAIKRMLERVK
jgi:pimeloyl-ACP methyl ester carboxylesterase